VNKFDTLQALELNQSEFEQFLNFSEKDTRARSDSEKILSFIQWCNSKGIEEVIIRLSAESKNWTSDNYFLDFTTSRVIVSTKSFRRKFIDTGFIAGMAPLPYVFLAKDKSPDFKKGTTLDPSEIIRKARTILSFHYSEIEEMHLRRGVETTITNMLGTAINANFLTIKTRDGERQSYRLPVSKNGSYEKMYFWLNVIVPVKVSQS
jgi:hypothetical protein